MIGLLEREILKDNPLAYWPLQEVSGNAIDIAGQGRHGTMTGGTVTQGASLLKNRYGSRSFNADGAYFSVADINAWDLQTLTLECWFASDLASGAEGSGEFLITQGGTTYNWGLYEATGDNYDFYVRIGGTVRVMGGTLPKRGAAGTVHHWVGTYDGAVMKMYWDGTEYIGPSIVGTVATNAGILAIGNYTGGSAPELDARMQHAAVYSGALSKARVEAHYQAGLADDVALGRWNSLQKDYLAVSFVMAGAANAYAYVDLTSVTDYTIQAGDFICYEVWWDQSGAKIAFDYLTSDSNYLRGNSFDQNGRDAHPDNYHPDALVLGKWYDRMIYVPPTHVGKTISQFNIACEADAANTYTGRIRNIRITDKDGNLRKTIWTGGAVTSAATATVTGYTSHTFTPTTGSIERSPLVMG